MILKDRKPGFQSKGVADHEIGQAIIQAVTFGTLLPSTPGWNYYTYHDPRKGCVFGMFVKPGEKAGEVVDVVMQDPPGQLAIKSPDGKLNLCNLDGFRTKAQKGAPEFLSHGIPEEEIPNAVMTALAAGHRVWEEEDDPEWQIYTFRYKHSPELKIGIKKSADGEVTDAVMRGKTGQAPAVAKPAVAKQQDNFDALLTGKHGESLKALAAGIRPAGMGVKELLGTVISAGNQVRSSLEHPGFGVYRKTIGGQAITLCGKIENGKLVVRLGSELDKMFAHFPEQERRYAQLLKEGWDIQVGPPGSGVYCIPGTKQIVFEPSCLYDPVSFVADCAHEMGHALYRMGAVDSEESHVREFALNEGNSLFTEYKLDDEVTDEGVKARLKARMNANPFAKEGDAIYEKWKHDYHNAVDQNGRDSADYVARLAYGEIYKKQQPSGLPDGVTYEQNWRVWYRQTMGSEGRVTQMEQLQKQRPPISIWDPSGKWLPPSFENVQVMHQLPKQAESNDPKLIFISKDTFARAAKGLDLPLFESFIKNGLNYGSLELAKSLNGSKESGIQNATCRFTKVGQPYAVHLTFDDSGKVFDLKLEVEEFGKSSATNSDEKAEEISSKTSPDPQSPIDWSGYREEELEEHREYIEDIKQRFS